MTDFDPYQILGVGREAEQGAIKTAYRLRVQDAHPDRGGNPDEFMAVVKAFGLLSNPELRQAYDHTGIVDLEGLKKYRSDVAAVLVDMFDAAVDSAVGSGLDLATVDFIELMNAAVSKGIKDAKDQSDRVRDEMTALEALSKRIRRNDEHGENLFVTRLSEQVKNKGEQQDVIQRRLLILETAGVELGNYASDVELIAALEATP